MDKVNSGYLILLAVLLKRGGVDAWQDSLIVILFTSLGAVGTKFTSEFLSQATILGTP